MFDTTESRTALQQRHKLFDGHFCLHNDGLDRLWSQISVVAWNYNMKMRFHIVAKVDVAPGLMMYIETRLQKGTQKLS